MKNKRSDGMLALLNDLAPGDATPGELLRSFRKRDGFTLDQLAEITELQPTNISSIENGKIPMTLHYAELFAAALRVHPAVLLYPDGKFVKDAKLKAIEKRAKQMLKRSS